MIIKELEYQHGTHNLNRKFYEDLPEELQVKEVGQIIQQADSAYDDEYRVLKIEGNEVQCIDIHTHIQRDFYLDSVRVSEKELKRIKRAKIQLKKAEAQRKRQEKEKKRAERTYQKLERENAKRLRTLNRKKQKEVSIKFI